VVVNLWLHESKKWALRLAFKVVGFDSVHLRKVLKNLSSTKLFPETGKEKKSFLEWFNRKDTNEKEKDPTLYSKKAAFLYYRAKKDFCDTKGED